MFDIKEVEKEARIELAAEQADKAKGKIKTLLKQIEASRKVTINLEHELEVLMQDIGN